MRKQLSKLAKRGEDLFCEVWKAASKPLGLAAKTCDKPFCPAGLFALAKLPCGFCVTVKALEIGHDKAEELRRIGIREGARISLLQRDDALLVSVENSRVAIGGKLAQHIKVQS